MPYQAEAHQQLIFQRLQRRSVVAFCRGATVPDRANTWAGRFLGAGAWGRADLPVDDGVQGALPGAPGAHGDLHHVRQRVRAMLPLEAPRAAHSFHGGGAARASGLHAALGSAHGGRA